MSFSVVGVEDVALGLTVEREMMGHRTKQAVDI